MVGESVSDDTSHFMPPQAQQNCCIVNYFWYGIQHALKSRKHGNNGVILRNSSRKSLATKETNLPHVWTSNYQILSYNIYISSSLPIWHTHLLAWPEWELSIKCHVQQSRWTLRYLYMCNFWIKLQSVLPKLHSTNPRQIGCFAYGKQLHI